MSNVNREKVMTALLDAWRETFDEPFYSISEPEEEKVRIKINKLFDAAATKINNIPSAHEAAGEWKEIYTSVKDYKKIYYQHECSCVLYDSPYNYCPCCGIKMRYKR